MDGSSTSNTLGFITSAREISSRRRSPPESTRAGLCRRSASRAYFANTRSAASFARSAARGCARERAAARRPPASARPQVRVEHARVALDLLGLALRQQLAVRQAIDVLREVHDHPHVVLDDQERDPELRVDLLQARE